MPSSPHPRKKADICLLLEGSYPYVRGGVSSWVHQLILGHPEYQFSLVFIGANRDHYKQQFYELPKNVCHFESHYLNESLQLKKPSEHRLDDAIVEELKTFYKELNQKGNVPSIDKLPSIKKLLLHPERLVVEDFFYSPQMWSLITKNYQTNCPDQPFNDYFWTVRSMHAPILALLQIAKNIPDARCYHTISTGYAGVLGMFLQLLKKKPLILSEHGIYTKERQIDLYQADWIKEISQDYKAGLNTNISYLRQLWMRFFENLGRLTYNASLVTITLYEQNRLKQIELGATPKRAVIIPNGVKIEKFIPLRSQRDTNIPPILCLLGRVVPIKDIKTYIRSIGLLVQKIPEAEGWIVGPEEEDKKYAEECHKLAKQLGLEEKVKFLGFQDINTIFPKVGLVVLSSISEGQPLVILEGFAAGVPAISTDVGCCRELIEGQGKKDQALGSAGSIVPLADPHALATAAASLLTDKKRWYKAQAAGIARVEHFYGEQIFLNNYHKLYHKVLNYGRNRV